MVSTVSTISPNLRNNSRSTGLDLCPHRVGVLNSDHGCDVVMISQKDFAILLSLGFRDELEDVDNTTSPDNIFVFKRDANGF